MHWTLLSLVSENQRPCIGRPQVLPSSGGRGRHAVVAVTGQLAGTTTRGLDNSRSRRCRKRTKTKHAKSPVASASCPVRDLSSTRVDQSARCSVRELAIRELSSCRLRALAPTRSLFSGRYISLIIYRTYCVVNITENFYGRFKLIS